MAKPTLLQEAPNKRLILKDVVKPQYKNCRGISVRLKNYKRKSSL